MLYGFYFILAFFDDLFGLQSGEAGPACGQYYRDPTDSISVCK